MSHTYAIVPSSVKPVSRSIEVLEGGCTELTRPLVGRLASRWRSGWCSAIAIALASCVGLITLGADRDSMAPTQLQFESHRVSLTLAMWLSDSWSPVV